MGWFDWLRSEPSNVEVLPSAIWLTDEARSNGILAAVSKIAEQANASALIYLIGHFSDSLDGLFDLAIGASANAKVNVCLSKDLNAVCRTGIPPTPDRLLEVIVVGRHPNPRDDDEVLRALETLPYRSRLSHHLSFDDILLRAFAGDSTRTTLRSLGMREDEPITSSIVSRRLRWAQNQIAKDAIGDFRASSAEEWLKLNCPTMWAKVH